MNDYIAELRHTVGEAASELLAIDADITTRRPSATGWSAREIIGHLIDSASNNHQRFVRACRQEDLVFPGYDQNEWVALQRYQEAPWEELVGLWRDYNRHLAHLMQAIPVEARYAERPQHNLHEIAWQTVPQAEPVTLDYFMSDYVGHLQHHLAQVRRLVAH
jgi:hypothetical protein